jgi:ribonuclease HI
MNPDLVVYLDSGCRANPGALAVAAVACTPDGEVLAESAREAGEGTNNLGEYRALAYAVCVANLIGARRPTFVSDSALVVQQINGFWAMHGDPGSPLVREHARCQTMLMRFDKWRLVHVPRERNKRADWLVSDLLGHKRTLKKAPAVQPVAHDGDGRPGWSHVPSSRKTPRASVGSEA